MRLIEYFTSPNTKRALDHYLVVVPPTWSVAHKLDLYSSAKIAFELEVSETAKRQAFRHVYDSLRSSGWQVFRNSSGVCWSSNQIFDALTQECQSCSRQSGLTLATLTEKDSRAKIEHCLKCLGPMKPTARYPAVYPWMAVAKFSHFFNPHLFPIYDTKFMWEKVANGTFKTDYVEFCRRRAFKPTEDTAQFNLQYTFWAAETIQNADEDCMETFGEWFAVQVKGLPDNESILENVEAYYAAAFEMIAIGAAHL